ncbi:immunoglobulin-like domain-containing protein [Bacillus sp. UNC41MFS5]|uniref:immunoglobulin-like domain-containing protein n=1 Tax=Bacillus sp. UNC41MFS5 TaxID=1449046 RepID=UPI0009DFC5F7|nr:immunoglobulin-like domain-containing protein [Bacillus sp. UNC41MFS5]
MKLPFFKAGILTCLTFSLFYGNASAESDLSTKCGEIKPNVNPSFQQINCLLTNAAIEADIPPEVVKAVATQENGKWEQFDAAGEAIESPDGGIGLMQLTNQDEDEYSDEKLRNDIVYNIEAGVKVLNSMYSRKDLPKISGAGRQVIENWYFAVLAYNGTKPVNSPLYQLTGERNTNAYQEEVFAKIEEFSYLRDTELAKYPFNTTDFYYNRDLTDNIKFNRLLYTLTAPVHNSAYFFKVGNRVATTVSGVKLREKPGTQILKELPKNTALIIDGDFTYDSTHQYVWYPVHTEDRKAIGYVSSVYMVKDTVKPVITGASSKSIPVKSTFNALTGVKALDNVDGEITRAIQVTGKVDTTKLGTYNLTYKVADKSMNVATVIRKITVYDNVKPIISGATNKTIRLNSSFNPRTSVTARDNINGNLTSKMTVSGTVNTKKKGTYTLKYTVRDNSNNVTTVTRKITIDSTKPVISGAKKKTIRYKSSFNPKKGVTAKDNLDGSLTSKIKVTGKVNTKKKGSYTLTYTVTDKSLNKTVVKRKITVK